MKSKELGYIRPPPPDEQAACLRLDTAIDKCLSAIKEMKDTVEFLSKALEHPFQLEALGNINDLLDEAMVPYLDQIDKEFKNVIDA